MVKLLKKINAEPANFNAEQEIKQFKKLLLKYNHRKQPKILPVYSA